MRIIVGYPPLWSEIRAAFDVEGKPVIYSWGPFIFNPMGVPITRELHAHEEIHGARQGDGDSVYDWWRKYIADPGFRLQEELPAHRAEYRAYCKRHASTTARNRFLDSVSKRLASDLYGALVTFEEARHAIVRESDKAEVVYGRLVLA